MHGTCIFPDYYLCLQQNQINNKLNCTTYIHRENLYGDHCFVGDSKTIYVLQAEHVLHNNIFCNVLLAEYIVYIELNPL